MNMMRRSPVVFLAALLFLGAAGIAPAAHAANTAVQPVSNFAPVSGSLDVPVPTLTQNPDGSYTSGTSGTQTVALPASSAAPAGAADPSAEKIKQQPPPPGKTADETSYGGIMSHIMGLFAWLLGVAAITLDYAAYYTVVKMGSLVGGVNGLAAVGVAWRILRDIGNIVLIFGFVAIGISIILDTKWYGGGTKMLPTLLVAAVFLNFSLFISEAVIDVGNLFATEFYTQINNGQIPDPQQITQNGFEAAVHNEGISTKIMNQLGLSTLYGDALTNQDIFKAGNTWFLGFMGILLFLVAAFVMFSLAFILIARFVILIFLIIVAPIGFAGLAVPQLKGTADSWWSALFDQTVTAPVLFLMLYVALAVITDAKFLTNFGVGSQNAAISGTTGGDWTAWLSGSSTGVGGLASAMLSFLVAMGLLLMVTVLARRLSAFGANWAKATAGKVVGGFTGRVVLGGLSLGARGTLGLSMRAANSKYVQARAANSLGFKALAFTGRHLENRTFDLRNSKIAQRAGGAIRSGLENFGQGSTGFGEVTLGKGATVSAKQAVDKAQEFGKISGITEMLTGGSLFNGSWWRDQQKKYEDAAKERDKKLNLNPDSAKSAADFEKEVQKASVDQLAELRGIRTGVDAFVQALRPSQYAALQKSDKLLKGEKDRLKDAWNRQFETPAGATAALSRFNPNELASTLDAKTLSLSHVAETLSPSQIDTIKKRVDSTDESRKISNADRDSIVKEWEKQFDDPAKAGMAIGNFTTAEIASLSGDILKKDTVAPLLGATELEAIRKKENLTSGDRAEIVGKMPPATFVDYFNPSKDKDGTRAKYWHVTPPAPPLQSQSGNYGNSSRWTPPGGVPPRNRPIR